MGRRTIKPFSTWEEAEMDNLDRTFAETAGGRRGWHCERSGQEKKSMSFYQEFVSELNRQEVRFLIFGGFAVNYYGYN